MEVIELMSDDEENSKEGYKSKVYNNCINFQCRSGVNMKPASSFACAYYGVIEKKKKKKRMICKECFYIALQHQKVTLINILKI